MKELQALFEGGGCRGDFHYGATSWNLVLTADPGGGTFDSTNAPAPQITDAGPNST